MRAEYEEGSKAREKLLPLTPTNGLDVQTEQLLHVTVASCSNPLDLRFKIDVDPSIGGQSKACPPVFTRGKTLMVIDLQPTLKGELLELRQLRAEDFEALYAVASDPLIWELHPASDRYKEGVFREFFRDGLESGGALIATDAATGEVIGSSRFQQHDANQSEVEIGWTFLARSRWGGQYNGEMKRLMLEHAFQFVDTVIFVVGPQNLRSRRAVEKIGGVLAESRPDPRGGVNVVYELTAANFAGH